MDQIAPSRLSAIGLGTRLIEAVKLTITKEHTQQITNNTTDYRVLWGLLGFKGMCICWRSLLNFIPHPLTRN